MGATWDRTARGRARCIGRRMCRPIDTASAGPLVPVDRQPRAHELPAALCARASSATTMRDRWRRPPSHRALRHPHASVAAGRNAVRRQPAEGGRGTGVSRDLALLASISPREASTSEASSSSTAGDRPSANQRGHPARLRRAGRGAGALRPDRVMYRGRIVASDGRARRPQRDRPAHGHRWARSAGVDSRRHLGRVSRDSSTAARCAASGARSALPRSRHRARPAIVGVARDPLCLVISGLEPFDPFLPFTAYAALVGWAFGGLTRSSTRSSRRPRSSSGDCPSGSASRRASSTSGLRASSCSVRSAPSPWVWPQWVADLGPPDRPPCGHGRRGPLGFIPGALKATLGPRGGHDDHAQLHRRRVIAWAVSGPLDQPSRRHRSRATSATQPSRSSSAETGTSASCWPWRPCRSSVVAVPHDPGFEIRTVGANPEPPAMPACAPACIIVLTMSLAGSLAGSRWVSRRPGRHAPHDRVLRNHRRLRLDRRGLLGASNPVGIVFAALLFGAMRSGAQLMQIEALIPRELVDVLQATILLFLIATPVVTRIIREARAPDRSGRGPNHHPFLRRRDGSDGGPHRAPLRHPGARLSFSSCRLPHRRLPEHRADRPVVATPIALAALCGVMCERAGVVNIGIEGIMIATAFVGWYAGVLLRARSANRNLSLRDHPCAGPRARHRDRRRHADLAAPCLAIHHRAGRPDHQRHDHQYRCVRAHRVPQHA